MGWERIARTWFMANESSVKASCLLQEQGFLGRSHLGNLYALTVRTLAWVYVLVNGD